MLLVCAVVVVILVFYVSRRRYGQDAFRNAPKPELLHGLVHRHEFLEQKFRTELVLLQQACDNLLQADTIQLQYGSRGSAIGATTFRKDAIGGEESRFGIADVQMQLCRQCEIEVEVQAREIPFRLY